MRPAKRKPEIDDIAKAEFDPLVPGPCPECGGTGFLEVVHLREGTAVLGCLDCDHRWDVPVGDDDVVVDLEDGAGEPGRDDLPEEARRYRPRTLTAADVERLAAERTSPDND